jgi:NAD(P)-dependent dehydrogenase (short-subunit alcohol dehydrogenase family)
VERRVIVTGAGSGIGLECALEAARLGFVAVAAVHQESQLDAVGRAAREAAVEVATEVLDVSDDARVAEVIERHEPWGLVNAAGLLRPALLADTALSEGRLHFDVMVFAPVRLAQLALSGMRRGTGGRIVNVSSVLGDENGPMLGWYQAATQALSAVSDTMRQELAHDGVDVVLVEAGPSATPLWGKAQSVLQRRRARSPEPEVYDRTSAVLDGLEALAADPKEVARTVGEALHAAHPKFRYRVGPGTSLTVLARAVPTSIRDRFTRTAAGL